MKEIKSSPTESRETPSEKKKKSRHYRKGRFGPVLTGRKGGGPNVGVELGFEAFRFPAGWRPIDSSLGGGLPKRQDGQRAHFVQRSEQRGHVGEDPTLRVAGDADQEASKS